MQLEILQKRLANSGLTYHDFRGSEIEVQQRLAKKLRELAVDHLRNGQGSVAGTFRGEYLAAGLGDYQAFLAQQGEEGAWATYIEAAAIGELLNLHVVVIPKKGNLEQEPICLHRATQDDAPQIILFNSNNTHWYSNAKTKGDGNCLYNALAQLLQNIVAPKLLATENSALVDLSFFQPLHNDQQTIESAISRQVTPAKATENLRSEKNRISKLPPLEQMQIVDDYKLALKLATEETSTEINPRLLIANRGEKNNDHEDVTSSRASMRVC